MILPGIVSQLLADESGHRGGSDSLAPKRDAFSTEGEAGHLSVHERRGLAHRFLGPEAETVCGCRQGRSGQRVSGRKGSFSMFLKRPQWEFSQHGECGTEVSSLFPQVGRVRRRLVRHSLDEIGSHKSLRSDAGDSHRIVYFRSTEHRLMGELWPWNGQSKPAIVRGDRAALALRRRARCGAATSFPAHTRGPWWSLAPNQSRTSARRASSSRLQQIELEAMARMNQRHLASHRGDGFLAARMKSFETAFGMQAEMPAIFDLSNESKATLDLYGLERGSTAGFAWQCLIARRLAERGVRFVELIDSGSANNWDAHGDMLTHSPLAKNVDRAIAGLLRDLKQRGMLEDTLVVWTTEFGRTPFNAAAGAAGREHHHWVFSSWLAGAGVKPGMTYGESDEYGINVARDPVHVHDFHATILHLMGLDHERLTYRHSGRDYRLTDVAGKVVRDVLG